MQKSPNTHRRILIYFLVELRAITPIVAAEYLFKVGAKSDYLDTLEDMQEIYQRKPKIYLTLQ